jgi:hypothetical protein
MLDLAVLNNFFNITELINISLIDKFYNNLIKNNLKKLTIENYNKNYKEQIGIIINSKNSTDKYCKNCKKECKTKYTDPFSNILLCNKCKTKTISKTNALKIYKLEEEDLKDLNYLYFKHNTYPNYITLYSLSEVFLKFYIKYKVINPKLIKSKKISKKQNSKDYKLYEEDNRWYAIIEILREYNVLHKLCEFRATDIIDNYIKKKSNNMVEIRNIIKEYSLGNIDFKY